jgi:hypothetical protein
MMKNHNSKPRSANVEYSLIRDLNNNRHYHQTIP